jgi:hypothetical protein
MIWPCDAGSFADWERNAYALGLVQQSDCFVCPAGHFCQSHTARPQPCPAGTYMPADGASFADPATAEAASQLSSAACLPCEAGYACPGQALTEMAACPAGTYSPPKSGGCYDCKEGHVCLSPLMTQAAYEASYCPAASTCAGLDAAPTECAAGYYCGGDDGAGTPFPAATTWERRGCPVGTYASTAAFPMSDQSECTPTTAGVYTDLQASLEGMEVPNECEYGHACPLGSRSAYETACPAGTY